MVTAIGVRRIALVLLLGMAAPLLIDAQQGAIDPEFAKVPFDQWLADGTSAQIKWTVHMLPAGLSSFQRLMAGIKVRVDGGELARRRGEGQLLMFVQIT